MSEENDDQNDIEDGPDAVTADGEHVEPDEVDGHPVGRDGGRISVMSLVGAACTLLTLSGIVLFSLTVSRVFDPAGTRCSFARTSIEDANGDDADYNDVAIDGETPTDVGDLPCDEAISLAEAIPTSEDGDDTLTVPSESALRSWGIVAVALGVLQVVGGVGTLMVVSRSFRTVAASAAAVGTVLPLFGILTLVMMFFVIWALVFSAQAKQIWGPIRLLGASRRSDSG